MSINTDEVIGSGGLNDDSGKSNSLTKPGSEGTVSFDLLNNISANSSFFENDNSSKTFGDFKTGSFDPTENKTKKYLFAAGFGLVVLILIIIIASSVGGAEPVKTHECLPH